MREFAKAFATIYRALPRWARWTIPIVIIVLIAAAAGSSSSKKTSGVQTSGSPTSSPAASAPTTSEPGAESEQATPAAHAKYVADANAACSRLNRLYGTGEKKQSTRLEELLHSGQSQPVRDEEIQVVEVLTLIATNRAKAFEAMKAPPGEDRALHSKLLASSKEWASDVKQVAEVISLGESPKSIEEALVLAKETGEEFIGLVERAHLTKCAG
jgi:hypothetical protein